MQENQAPECDMFKLNSTCGFCDKKLEKRRHVGKVSQYFTYESMYSYLGFSVVSWQVKKTAIVPPLSVVLTRGCRF